MKDIGRVGVERRHIKFRLLGITQKKAYNNPSLLYLSICNERQSITKIYFHSLLTCMQSCDYWHITIFTQTCTCSRARAPTHTHTHLKISLIFYLNALTQKYQWQINCVLEHLFSAAVYKGGSVGCDAKFKFDVTYDNLYTVFQNSTFLSIPQSSAQSREKV